jgi:hypothetical protein
MDNSLFLSVGDVVIKDSHFLDYNLNIRRDDLDTFGNGTDGDSIVLERLPFIIF